MKNAPLWHAIARELFLQHMSTPDIARYVNRELGLHKSSTDVRWLLDIAGCRESARRRARESRWRSLHPECKPVVKPPPEPLKRLSRGHNSHTFVENYRHKPTTPLEIQDARRQRTMELCVMFARDEITRAELSLRLRSEAT